MATNENEPDHPSRPAPSIGRVMMQKSSFLRVTEIASLTARAVPRSDEVSHPIAYLMTKKAHIDSVDQAVTSGTLRLFDPITLTELSSAQARQTVGGGNQCMVAWDDFVTFAASMGISVDIQVAADATETQTGTALAKRAKPVHKQQEEQVLEAIAALKYTASDLPKRIQGKAGVKSQVRKKLRLSKDVFNKAWARLRADGRIKEKG